MENNVYMPDILNCLANLSSDEVFTPPELANRMLDLLPPELFTNPETTFLDPCTKSGVFLREITKRLLAGLEAWEPDLQRRLDHILTRQVFGIALTQLTADMSRRTLYCTKRADEPKYSVTQAFVQSHNPQGHVLFSRIGHTWDNGKCRFCGASETVFGDKMRQGLETHAYQFIHTLDPQELFNMTFDVIIGNPPYQMDDGGNGVSAKPIYHLFVQQAQKLKPHYLCMIIPSRWYAGGKGLQVFRANMLNNHSIKYLKDYSNAKDCFPQNSISGGVCIFLMDRDYSGNCFYVSVKNGEESSQERKLDEFPVFIRYNEATSIIHKVNKSSSEYISDMMLSRNPFGCVSSDRGVDRPFSGCCVLISSQGTSYINSDKISQNRNVIASYKVMISKVTSEHAGEPDQNGQVKILSSLKTLRPYEVCTDSYLIIGHSNSEIVANNICSYLKTKFARFLLLQAVSSINLSKDKFQFVPIQDFTKPWTDAELYEKYGLDEKEIAFIESMIRPMED